MTDVWPEERDKWRPDLSIAVADGTPAQREKALTSGADIVVVSRNVLHQAAPFADRFTTFVMDESSSFKERGSRMTKAAMAISKVVPRAIALTGTPSPNGYMDLWSQMFILDRGERLYNGITKYRTRYFSPQFPLPNGVIPGYDLRPGADKLIEEKIADICLSMQTEGRVELPPVTYNRVSVPLDTKSLKMYKTLERDFVVGLDLLGEMASADNAAALSNKLCQLTAGFLYVDDQDLRGGLYEVVHKEKVNALKEIVDGTGSPVLVFYRYKAELEMIREALPQARNVTEDGVIKEWNEGKVPVLLAHPQSAGHGLNLQYGGHTIVWTSATWSLEEWQQSNKRLARSGQQNPVVIHTLEVPGTVDGAIVAALEEKRDVQQGLLDYLESPV